MDKIINEISNTIPNQNETNQQYKYSKKNSKHNRRCTCNIWQCTYCNGNRPKPTKEKLEEIKRQNKLKGKTIPFKHCGFDCKYCYIKIPYANKFIMDLNIEIREQKIAEQKQKENEEKNKQKIMAGKMKKNTNEKEIRNNQNINLNEANTEVNRDHFVLNRVRGDGNCTLREILKSAGIDENQHAAEGCHCHRRS